MKNKVLKFLPIIIIVICFVLLIPAISNRIIHEGKNDNVTVGFLYNSLKEKLDTGKRLENVEQFKKMGVNTAVLMEEDVNWLVVAGEITCIRYNVLLHKYDDESMRVGYAIRDNCPRVTLNSHIMLVKRPEIRERLRYEMPRRYTEDDYMLIPDVEGMDIYVLYDSYKNLYEFSIGFNEQDIKYLKNEGFEVSLIHTVKDYKNTKYLEDLERLVKEYDIEFLNLKADAKEIDPEKANSKNYEAVLDILIDNDMTLVVTETGYQLKNIEFYGYNEIIDGMTKNGRKSKIVRSIETYDDSLAGLDHYKHRTTQHFNSVVDRNARFIVVTQIYIPAESFDYCAERTMKATEVVIDMLKDEGYRINDGHTSVNYKANTRYNHGLCAVIMIMACLVILRIALRSSFNKLTVIAILASIAAFGLTYIMPASLLGLYSTVYSAVMSCFAVAFVVWFVDALREKLHIIPLTILTLISTLAVILIGSVGLGSLLSGLDYYINTDIFRGIKLSLIAPVVFVAALFYILYIHGQLGNIIKVISDFLKSEIKVYWLLLAGVIGFVGYYYILRSGNVSSISSIESAMRTFLTEQFAARPRTKEFLIGWPCLVLFVYYMKKTNIKLIQWLLAIATAILTASATNSFCHVFTDYTFIVSRTLNGLLVGLIACIAAIALNAILVKIARIIYTKFFAKAENK